MIRGGNNNGQKRFKIASSQQQFRVQMFFTASVHEAETSGNGEFLNHRQTATQQDMRHNGGNGATYVSHFKVVEGEGRQRLG